VYFTFSFETMKHMIFVFVLNAPSKDLIIGCVLGFKFSIANLFFIQVQYLWSLNLLGFNWIFFYVLHFPLKHLILIMLLARTQEWNRLVIFTSWCNMALIDCFFQWMLGVCFHKLTQLDVYWLIFIWINVEIMRYFASLCALFIYYTTTHTFHLEFKWNLSPNL
jgi:hypothetical protein